MTADGAGEGPDWPDLMRQVKALAEAGDWDAICALLEAPPPGPPPFAALSRGVQAGLATSNRRVLEWAAGTAATRDLPQRARATLCMTMANHGAAGLAWSVLAADPAALWDPDARRLVSLALAAIAAQSNDDPVRRAAARALQRRLSIEEEPPEPRHFAAPDCAAVADAAFPLAIRLAPGVDAAILAQIAALREASEARLRGTAPAAVDVFEDVYVNRIGNVWRANGRLVGAQPGVLPAGTGAAMAVAPRVATGEMCTGATGNLYHWFGSHLPAMTWRRSADAPAGLPALLRDDAPAYQAESLRHAFGSDLPLLAVGAAVHVGRLYVPRRVYRLDPAGPYEAILARLSAAADRLPRPEAAGRRLYLSRRDAPARAMRNEEALETRLRQMGFTAVTMSGRPLLEQIAIMRAASVVVAPHGAGLALLLFAHPGTRVFEMLPAMRRSLAVRLCMTEISRARGHRHLAWFEDCNEVTGAWACSIAPMLQELRAFLAAP